MCLHLDSKILLFLNLLWYSFTVDILIKVTLVHSYMNHKDSLKVRSFIHSFIELNFFFFNYYLDSNVVVVTFNYRLGVLGFLATRSGSVKGNYAFQDQLLVLKWVQQNIKLFGGDPSQVTLVGQSAGGASVRAHLISPISKGLFHKAIIQSDPLGLPMIDPVEMFEYAAFYMDRIGCKGDESCLRYVLRDVSCSIYLFLIISYHLIITLYFVDSFF